MRLGAVLGILSHRVSTFWRPILLQAAFTIQWVSGLQRAESKRLDIQTDCSLGTGAASAWLFTSSRPGQRPAHAEQFDRVGESVSVHEGQYRTVPLLGQEQRETIRGHDSVLARLGLVHSERSQCEAIPGRTGGRSENPLPRRVRGDLVAFKTDASGNVANAFIGSLPMMVMEQQRIWKQCRC